MVKTKITTMEKYVMRATPEIWDKMLKFIDENPFYIEDMLALVCANLLKSPENVYETQNMVGGHEFKIRIERKEWRKGVDTNKIN